MSGPVSVVYGRVTRQGVIRSLTRHNKPMLSFVLAVHVEQRDPITSTNEAIDDADDRRRRPWWLRCIATSRTEMKRAETLGPHDYTCITGRLDRRRILNEDTETWREEWTLFIDSIATLVPGSRMPMDSADSDTDQIDKPENPKSGDDGAVAGAETDAAPGSDPGGDDSGTETRPEDGEPVNDEPGAATAD